MVKEVENRSIFTHNVCIFIVVDVNFVVSVLLYNAHNYWGALLTKKSRKLRL